MSRLVSSIIITSTFGSSLQVSAMASSVHREESSITKEWRFVSRDQERINSTTLQHLAANLADWLFNRIFQVIFLLVLKPPA